MTSREILRIAMAQSAADANCAAGDFEQSRNVIVPSVPNPGARKYLELPFTCNLISYGTNIVASIDMQYENIVRKYIDSYPPEHCFETPNLQVLNSAFMGHDMQVCFMAEYFLPDLDALTQIKCKYETRVLEQADFKELYKPEWSNALCEKRKELDILGVGAYKDGNLIGLAACSADCENMWQIGIDVLPGFRKQGIASALTSALTREILKRDKVPFYCCAWSNIGSARTAIRSGYRPAWVEMTVKPREYVERLNRIN